MRDSDVFSSCFRYVSRKRNEHVPVAEAAQPRLINQPPIYRYPKCVRVRSCVPHVRVVDGGWMFAVLGLWEGEPSRAANLQPLLIVTSTR